MNELIGKTGLPKEKGYYFPAEWHPHAATWLSWPHKEASWPGKLHTIYEPYSRFIKEVSLGEQVCINVTDEAMEELASNYLINAEVDLTTITFFLHPTDDSWCRDHGPAFLINPEADIKKVIIDWGYNAWGNKYPPYEQDDIIPTLVGKALDIPVYYPGIVMEGGSVDFNGKGTILTTRACLLNKNRNPHLNQHQIEEYLYQYYGVSQILWLDEGIVGDDTDGHIDDITRFVNADTIVTVVEENRADENYPILQKNLQSLKNMRLMDGKQFNIVELPMPAPVMYEGQQLPASYANFYISNAAVVVPTYRDPNDQKALDILATCFPDRKVVGIDSIDIIWGLGSWHCLSQQEPEI
ncbi:agmatine deiminase family protein [Parapedobacter tibetensis]|uniref:agmatine deiminase family protein n=1 Tax=Parapedobacter tibetensis TaxID=2972951 RepID=UPI00214D6226|nr:agmatine deiminase family protein [Parapedobacter tibetensis]